MQAGLNINNTNAPRANKFQTNRKKQATKFGQFRPRLAQKLSTDEVAEKLTIACMFKSVGSFAEKMTSTIRKEMAKAKEPDFFKRLFNPPEVHLKPITEVDVMDTALRLMKDKNTDKGARMFLDNAIDRMEKIGIKPSNPNVA